MRRCPLDFPLHYERPAIPVIDIDQFRAGGMSWLELEEVTRRFADLGVVCLRTSRVNAKVQAEFRNAMLKIHGASEQERAEMDGADTGYQFGMTPPGAERPLDHSAWVATLRSEHRPLTVPGQADPKARFMWPIGPRPKRTRWPKVNAGGGPVPARFRHIAEPLTTWGNHMLTAARELLKIVAVGIGLDSWILEGMLSYGPHILGPTGSDFSSVWLGQVLAGLHYDFNAVTIHGQSNIRALICWTRDGHPFLVEVPDGCLLAQAGKSLEWVTGGFFHAGKHEVIVTPEALEDAARLAHMGGTLIRVSSNLFVHFATRRIMRPLGRFATPEALRQYPSIYGGDYETRELVQIGLFPESDLASANRAAA